MLSPNLAKLQPCPFNQSSKLEHDINIGERTQASSLIKLLAVVQAHASARRMSQ